MSPMPTACLRPRNALAEGRHPAWPIKREWSPTALKQGSQPGSSTAAAGGIELIEQCLTPRSQACISAPAQSASTCVRILGTVNILLALFVAERNSSSLGEQGPARNQNEPKRQLTLLLPALKQTGMSINSEAKPYTHRRLMLRSSHVALLMHCQR